MSAAEPSPFSLLESYVATYRQRRDARVSHQLINDSYLAFSAGEDNFLLEMSQILEVVTVTPEITALPFSPSWLLGLTSQRGNIYSVVDFKQFVSPKQQFKPQRSPSFLFLCGLGQGYALKVDSVLGIRSSEMSLLQSQLGWVDGHTKLEGRDWMRINLGNLIADATFIQNMQ